jgi:type II secretory pathway pseudopilin PulG
VNRTRTTAGVLAATAAAVTVGRVLSSRRNATGTGLPSIGSALRGPVNGPSSTERWHAVTVNRPAEVVAPGGQLPGPLAELGETIEVRLVPAPGDRGTEVHARLAGGGDKQRLRQLRTALRDAKQLVETGEILSPDKPATTKRTLLSRPLEYATAHGKGDGLL